MFTKKKEVFLDHAAGSPIDPRVTESMSQWLDASWNPSAIHPRGVKARKAVEDARKTIATLLYAHPDEITFTSSATEAIHMAISSAVARYEGDGIPEVISTPIEHHAVLEPLRALEEQGRIRIFYLPLLSSGVIDPSVLKKLLSERTCLVAVMYANNEIGTIQPVREVTKIVRNHKKSSQRTFPYVLSDACQAFTSLECHVERLGIDYLVLNGPKVSGPQGSALLYVKRKAPLLPIFLGGAQESAIRAGTENVAAIVGLATALDIAQKERRSADEKVAGLRDRLEVRIRELAPDVHVNGSGERVARHLNVTFPGADHQYLALALGEHDIMVGTKSACRENEDGNSHVLTALRDAGDAQTLPAQGIRFSLGKGNTLSDIERVHDALSLALPLSQKSRTIAP